ncbi:hypothetical protein VHUM_02785 [Vanrija humicola]|uniref:Xylulose kinase n=1 Tax=Vanrija humicola TaxID=5417 RepID=A0A7D8V047_VANHU|nr:hypothetical protein VHUM_02785 [Vanrija humicola]
MPPPLFLGLDCSTQALKASLLSAELAVLGELEVRFDADLPAHGTRGGVLHGPEGSGEVFSPVLQPLEALDLLLERIAAAGWDVGAVRAVSAAGQQHATVYWSSEAPRLLGALDAGGPLAQQLARAFSRDIIPNWQDSSTAAECAALTAALGSADGLADATGSSAHRRFSGAQIAKFLRVHPQAYADTARISLVSSLMTTLLCADGEVKGIDESDACGMNLWDMRRRVWSEQALAAVGGADTAALRSKLGLVETDGGRVVGHIGKWFTQRYGFSPECVVLPGTGDNPATFLSLVLRESEGLLSLGTSDVVMVSTAAYTPHPEYHAFFHPAQIAPPSADGAAVDGAQPGPLRYFNMLVYKNGSLAREHVRDKYFASSWQRFNDGAERLRPKSAADVPSRTAFWWLLPDIIPANAHGVHKYEGQDADTAAEVDAFADADAEALAILESQMLNYRSRSAAILGSPAGLSRAYVAGGAGKNPTICAVAADVLACPVSKAVEWDGDSSQWAEAGWNACSVGVAYKARWGWEREVARQKGDHARASIGFDELIAEIRRARRAALPADALAAADAPDDEGVANVALPGPGAGAYDDAVGWWQALEGRALAAGN